MNYFSELSEYALTCCGVILGSDQVWNPQNLEMNYHTLNFLPVSIPKVTYAPSFGVSRVLRYQKRTRDYLSKIKHISVRELAGSIIVKELTGKGVPVVCDPTALLTREQWNILKSNKSYTSDKHIFCYFLGKNVKYQNFVRKASG